MKHRAVYVFIGPFLLLFSVFFVYPLVYEFWLSLHRSTMGVSAFAGLANYRVALGDAAFWHGMAHVAVFGILQIITVQILGLAIALFLDGPWIKGKALFRMVYLLPYAVPGVIASLMWGFLLAPGLDPALKLWTSAFGGNAPNLLSPGNLLYTVLIIVTWSWAGWNMTLFYAALTGLPIEIYEAAKLDGCSELQLALNIKVPLVRPMIVFTVLLSVIGGVQLFNEPFVLSAITPVSPSYTPNLYAYNMGFNYDNFNYAATLSFILAALTLVVSAAFLLVTARRNRRAFKPPTASRGGIVRAGVVPRTAIDVPS